MSKTQKAPLWSAEPFENASNENLRPLFCYDLFVFHQLAEILEH
jgi:hypothetical protein